jgi:hypothetical protein
VNERVTLDVLCRLILVIVTMLTYCVQKFYATR